MKHFRCSANISSILQKIFSFLQNILSISRNNFSVLRNIFSILRNNFYTYATNHNDFNFWKYILINLASIFNILVENNKNKKSVRAYALAC